MLWHVFLTVGNDTDPTVLTTGCSFTVARFHQLDYQRCWSYLAVHFFRHDHLYRDHAPSHSLLHQWDPHDHDLFLLVHDRLLFPLLDTRCMVDRQLRQLHPLIDRRRRGLVARLSLLKKVATRGERWCRYTPCGIVDGVFVGRSSSPKKKTTKPAWWVWTSKWSLTLAVVRIVWDLE